MSDQLQHNVMQSNWSNQLLSVIISKQEFAIRITAIREIRGWIASTPLPHAPPYVIGMINLRGAVLAIIDLASRLGMVSEDPTAASVVVVVEEENQVVGLLVDAVNDIITVTNDMRQSIPSVGDLTARNSVDGLIMIDDRIISIISLGAVVPARAELEPEMEPVS